MKTPTAPSTLLGALQVATMVLTAPLARRWFNAWGTTAAERIQALPGDDLVVHPRLTSTRAVSIAAPPAAVWPWLVQLGQGRGGWYSYDGLENLVGCQIHSADRILPAHQRLAVGDHVLFGPPAKHFPGQVVVAIEPERALVMCGLNPATRQPERSATWALVLQQQPGGHTRLLARGRNRYPPGLANHLLWHLVEPIAFVMERRMLLGIKERVERASRPGERVRG